MTQLVARIPDDVAEALDNLVASGAFESRSDAVREALLELLDRHRRGETARRIVEGYRRRPQSEDEIEWADAATVAMIADEPW
jgi:Arc/MetJ-type ribon-helix-helix transcriptional regulator